MLRHSGTVCLQMRTHKIDLFYKGGKQLTVCQCGEIIPPAKCFKIMRMHIKRLKTSTCNSCLYALYLGNEYYSLYCLSCTVTASTDILCSDSFLSNLQEVSEECLHAVHTKRV